MICIEVSSIYDCVGMPAKAAMPASKAESIKSFFSCYGSDVAERYILIVLAVGSVVAIIVMFANAF